jgi:hypothetical protein
MTDGLFAATIILSFDNRTLESAVNYTCSYSPNVEAAVAAAAAGGEGGGFNIVIFMND